jgi:hypothetical protein
MGEAPDISKEVVGVGQVFIFFSRHPIICDCFSVSRHSSNVSRWWDDVSTRTVLSLYIVVSTHGVECLSLKGEATLLV